ncbi:hypothetical protein [Xanthomonas campestris]|uniref:hypothetical protein n=1 Tax=Xanthomonas campestris TaxID=339 RepID=UPI001F416F8A|nr:hypothetical protein [Xanthomonas campestris]MCF8878053.1 hypothetical protein [Xanthomonas campestris pv. campestris]
MRSRILLISGSGADIVLLADERRAGRQRCQQSSCNATVARVLRRARGKFHHPTNISAGNGDSGTNFSDVGLNCTSAIETADGCTHRVRPNCAAPLAFRKPPHKNAALQRNRSHFRDL